MARNDKKNTQREGCCDVGQDEPAYPIDTNIGRYVKGGITRCTNTRKTVIPHLPLAPYTTSISTTYSTVRADTYIVFFVAQSDPRRYDANGTGSMCTGKLRTWQQEEHSTRVVTKPYCFPRTYLRVCANEIPPKGLLTPRAATFQEDMPRSLESATPADPTRPIWNPPDRPSLSPFPSHPSPTRVVTAFSALGLERYINATKAPNNSTVRFCFHEESPMYSVYTRSSRLTVVGARSHTLQHYI